MSMNIPPRSSSSKLQGPRPPTLKVSKSSSKIMKSAVANNNNDLRRSRSPVVIYLVSPKIIHVRREEFMGLVQRLTGKQATSSETSCTTVMESNNSISSHNEVMNYADQVALSSPCSNLAAAYPGLCIDIYADWDDF